MVLIIVVCPCSEPYVTEDELKLMLRGAELSGAIEEEEQVREIQKILIRCLSLTLSYIFLLFYNQVTFILLPGLFHVIEQKLPFCGMGMLIQFGI